MTLLKRAFAAGLAAILLALVLTPASEIASAHPSHPVTTVLLPGFNLAGWIEPEASVDELFEVLPELKAVYAWDALEQRYRSSSAQRAGDLTTLTPGMGLWLDIDGDEPVFWIRSAAPDPATGLVTLRAGWNLVAWYGSENESFEHAFATLDAESQFVLAWDAESQWFISHVPGATSTGAGVVRVGDAVWVSSPEERRWLQPGSVVPRVEFYGDFPAERKAEIRAETLSVVTWFAERYGLLEPDFILFVGADRASLDQAHREILGIENPSYVLCGQAINKLVFLADWCATATHDLTSPLAHEYFHVLQTHLVERTPGVGTVYVADWLLEGTAEHMAIAYSISRGFTAAEDVEREFLDSATYNRQTLSDLEANISQFDTDGYLLAAFAVELLVGLDGTAAISEFFRVLPSRSNWQDAFGTVFGRPPSAFYEEVSDYVAANVPELRTVHVTIRGPDGRELHEWNGYPLSLRVSQSSSDGEFPGARMDETGGVLRLPDGAYVLSVGASCVVRGGDFFQSILSVTVAWYTSSNDPALGDPRFHGGQAHLRVEGEDLPVVINLAGWPSEMNINCHGGPRYEITGTVVGEDGELRTRYEILAYPDTGTPSRAPLYWNYTDETGAFTIDAPDGYSYALTVKDTCGTFIGIYHEDFGLIEWSTDGGLRNGTHIPIDGADAPGIDIVIPASLDTGDDC